jgi:DNA primase
LPPALPPGDVVLLTELKPSSLPRVYLTGRGFDVEELATIWSLGYCYRSSYRQMENRIYIPIVQDGELVGWQGRWPGATNRQCGEIPRYYTMPGLQKSKILYNMDSARGEPLVVICEGCSDVWRVGAAGVALLGKTASREQLRLLTTIWAGKTAVILLDADAATEARELFQRLRPFFGRRLVLAMLPEGLDPGVCPRESLWAFLQSAAAVQGVMLSEIGPADRSASRSRSEGSPTIF